MTGDRTALMDTPLVFIQALKGGKVVELDEKNLYHFKRPGLAEADMGWGKPVILAAMKKIYYLQVLQKGNEAIANEHIVPKKAISPANTTTLDPYTQMNLGKWKGEIETTVKRWKQDPNYIAVFPIPVAYQELGGNARALLLTPEMRFLEETIINSLGVPVEFIKGGASWTGSSISLRIVENMFLSYRAMLEDFINHFIIEKVVSNFKYEKVKMRFKDFKMADDAAAKQLMLQLSEMGKLSDASLLDSFGLNYNANKTQLEESANEDIDRAVKRSKKEAEAQGEAAVVLAKFNAIAQAEAQAELLRYRIQQFQEELIDEFGSVDANFFNLIEQLTLGLLYMAPEMQIVELDKLKTKTPITHNLVMERINAYQSANIMPTGANLSLKKQAPNQKSPGERESNQVKPREKEKTKGATRGEENI
jgi:hypothetical protein